jgi:hypothetical protein
LLPAAPEAPFALSWTRSIEMARDVDPILLLCSAIAGQAVADSESRAQCEVCARPRCHCSARFLEHLRSFDPTDPTAIAVDMLRIAGA